MSNICIKYKKVGCYIIVTQGDKFHSVYLKGASISGNNQTIVVNDVYGNSATLTPKQLQKWGFIGNPVDIVLSWISECSKTAPIPPEPIAWENIYHYEKVLIWAEEFGTLKTNQNEWSFGNGGTGGKGIPIPEANWEIYAFGLQADKSSNGATATIEIINRVNDSIMGTMPIASGPSNNINFSAILASPITINQGDSIGFRTQNVKGTISDVIVSIWLRREVCLSIRPSN